MVGILSPSPRVHVRSELLGQLRDRFGQAAQQQLVAPLCGIRSESSIRRVEPVDDALHARLADERLRVLRDHQAADVRREAALEHLVDAGGDRISVDAVIPREEQLTCPLRCRSRGRSRSQTAKQRHDAAGRQRHVVVLQPHHVGDGVQTSGAEHLADPRHAKWIGPGVVQRFLVLEVRREQIVVRRREIALRRILAEVVPLDP